MRRPREKNRGAGGSWWRVMSVMHMGMKSPGRLMTVGTGTRGFLDDLHVGADAFRGDVDVSGP